MRRRLGTNLLFTGAAASVAGLIGGLGMMFHYFYVTPAAACLTAFARLGVFEVWPWLLPLLIFETAALLHAGAGILMVRGSPLSSVRRHL